MFDYATALTMALLMACIILMAEVEANRRPRK